MLDRVTGMQIFVRVANLGGFSAAARSLFANEPIWIAKTVLLETGWVLGSA